MDSAEVKNRQLGNPFFLSGLFSCVHGKVCKSISQNYENKVESTCFFPEQEKGIGSSNFDALLSC